MMISVRRLVNISYTHTHTHRTMGGGTLFFGTFSEGKKTFTCGKEHISNKSLYPYINEFLANKNILINKS